MQLVNSDPWITFAPQRNDQALNLMKAHIVTPTPLLQDSLRFYDKLGFSLTSSETHLVTDGQVLIQIDPDRYARAGIVLHANDWTTLTNALPASTPNQKIEDGHLVHDPSGVRVILKQGEGPSTPFEHGSKSVLGNFSGVSIEAADMESSVLFWKTLGFAVTMGDAAQGWVSLAAEGCPGISIMRTLMCPHLFFNPSLTYFNGKEGNPKVIAAVRKAGIPITEEITHFNKEGMVDNIIIRDPGGFGFFLFND